MGGDSLCDGADFGWEGVGSSSTLGLEQQEPIFQFSTCSNSDL